MTAELIEGKIRPNTDLLIRHKDHNVLFRVARNAEGLYMCLTGMTEPWLNESGNESLLVGQEIVTIDFPRTDTVYNFTCPNCPEGSLFSIIFKSGPDRNHFIVTCELSDTNNAVSSALSVR